EVEHVIEEADARLTRARAFAVEHQVDLHIGLVGLAIDLSAAAHARPFSPMRASIDRAWSSNPSARATGAARTASSPGSVIRTSENVRRKCCGLSVEANRAAPF